MANLTDVPTDTLRTCLETARYYEETEAAVPHDDGPVTKHTVAAVEAELVARGRCD